MDKPGTVNIFCSDGVNRNVFARELVAKIAKETGIPFAEVLPEWTQVLSEEDAAILELAHTAEELDAYWGRYANCPDEENGGRHIFAGGAFDARSSSYTALLAKVKAAMQPKRTRAEIKEELLCALLEWTEGQSLLDIFPDGKERVQRLKAELAEAK